MKILHLIYDHVDNPWVGGGGAIRALEIYRRLSGRHEITIVCGKYPGAADHVEGNLTVRFAGTGRNNYVSSTFSYACRAARLLRKEGNGFDVVIEDFAPYNPLFSFLGRKDAIIQVHQKEGVRHLRKYGVLGIPFLFIETFYPRLFGNYIAISEMSRKRFRMKGKGGVIPNGFDPELTVDDADEKDFVLFLGRLHVDQKGLDVLSDAVKHVAIKLLIAGSGKDEAMVRRLFSGTIHSGTTEMTGFVNGQRKSDLLRSCRFLVMPSRYEGQPLVLAEAAACGKAVIVSDIAELHYAVEAGFGLAFRQGDPEDLAEKIMLLAGDEALRKVMGTRAREYAKEYTWDKIAARYEIFLKKLTAGKD